MLRVRSGLPILLPPSRGAVFSAAHGVAFAFFHQEEDNWCWAACIRMIESVRRPTQMRRQCEIVSQTAHRDDCCSSSPSPCSEESALDARLEFAVRTVRPQADPPRGGLNEQTLVQQLERGAVLVTWRWSDPAGGGHVVLVVGSKQLPKGDRLFITHDPLMNVPDECSYYDLSTARGLGSWTRSWTNL